MSTKKLTIAALLTAAAIIIPFIVFLKVVIPPFTATLGAHVPMFIAMMIGPEVAIMVGIGSALGFFLNLGPLVGARALMHVIVGVIGAKLIKRNVSFGKVVAITAPIHGLLEGLVVFPFVGADVYNLIIITVVGTILHHIADGFIAQVIVRLLGKTQMANFVQ